MKKIYWIVPAAVFVASLAMVVILNRRDIKPEDMVYKKEAAELVSVTETRAVSMLENNLDAFSLCAADAAADAPDGVSSVERDEGLVKFILDEQFGSFTQYLAYGGAGEGYDTKAGEGYNVAAYRRELADGWTYCVDFIKPLTFTDYYEKDIAEALGSEKAESYEFILMSKENCPSPAEKSRSAYVVRARVMLESGEIKTCFVDPKTKLFIGFEE